MAKNPKPNRGLPRLPAADAPSPEPGLQPPEITSGRLIVRRSLLDQTLRGLAARSAGWRESAAIWAGTLAGTDSIAASVFFHHELCDDRGGPLSLELSEDAKLTLYQLLHQQNLKLISLLHTHPEDWVGLSPVDQRNQLCSRIGFWSLVVPWYGQEPWDLAGIGVHIKSNQGWLRFRDDETSRRIIIGEP